MAEPRIIEQARRFGWAALVLSLVIALVWRIGDAPGWVAGLAVASLLAGGLAVVNVALVRSLYRQLDNMSQPVLPPGDAD